jgi:hypothetical protein
MKATMSFFFYWNPIGFVIVLERVVFSPFPALLLWLEKKGLFLFEKNVLRGFYFLFFKEIERI